MFERLNLAETGHFALPPGAAKLEYSASISSMTGMPAMRKQPEGACG